MANGKIVVSAAILLLAAGKLCSALADDASHRENAGKPQGANSKP